MLETRNFPLPPDEIRRLDALKSFRILDTPREPAFDELAQLAAFVCDAPIALVSLVAEDRQWFKSCVGIEATETGRDVSFCAHAILKPDHVFVVPNALEDRRFAENPLVTGDLHVRFYAGVPLKTPEGQPLGTICVIDRVPRDLPPEKIRALSYLARQAEAQLVLRRSAAVLRESEEKYRTILETIQEGYFEIDLTGRLTFFNRAMSVYSGYSADELRGMHYRQYLHPNGAEELLGAFSQVLATGKPNNAVEWQTICGDGSTKFGESSISLMLDESNKPAGFRGLVRDVTERKRFEAELRAARDAALESARLKSEFLANMSHEIRTPMNAVIGMTNVLLDTRLDREQRDYAETIRQSADGLLTIINDILDFSKIEAGKLAFETVAFDLRETVENAVELLAERAHAKRIELTSFVDAAVPVQLQGDPGRLRQILTNLVGNAIKFTEAGEVVVRATCESETQTHTIVRFDVIDTGIGIAEAAQRNLFEAFVQADGSTTRKYGGTGLGLAISKQLVEHMNGVIGVSSELGKGANFWFTATFEKQTNVQAALKPKENLDNLRVLIVDDNATNRKILQHQTQAWRMISESAESSAAGLEKLRAAAVRSEPFDLAILDLMMPEMDGFELARKIKADPLVSNVRLMLLTSFGQRGHTEKSLEIGVAAYLTKPVRQSQLYDCLTAIMGDSLETDAPRLDAPKNENSANPTAEQSPAPNQELSSKRILLAEDNPVNQKLALMQLKKLGYAADTAANGREAVAACDGAEYDLIFMDCQMPEMDGYEATAEIRSREAAANRKRTAIVAMTANALEGDRERCLNAGMDDYLSKPVNFQELKRILENRLAEREKPEPAIDRNESRIPSAPPVDAARLTHVMGDDPAEVAEILTIYLQSIEENIAKLNHAITAQNADEIDFIAHNCAGVSANCGMTALENPFRELERMSRANQFDDAPRLAKIIAAEFDRTQRFLRDELKVF